MNVGSNAVLLINRSLRTAPGMRGIGKHWEMDSMSSEIDSDSDESHKAVSIFERKLKTETRLIVFFFVYYSTTLAGRC